MSTNIYNAVPFTWIRCLFFLGSMTLYTTDVVRSGLGIKNLVDFGQHKSEMETFTSFGPYAYPLQTIRRNASHQAVFHAVASHNAGGPDNLVEAVPIWPYKFDTLSIGTRALATELDVQEYPKCILSANPPCPSKQLSVETTFTMLDGLVEAVQTRLMKGSCYVQFAVEHQWIDTIEMTLYGMVHDLHNMRYYAIHSYRQNATNGNTPVQLMALCRFPDPKSDRPLFCNSVRWTTHSSLPFRDSNASREVNIGDDIALRFARFQAENPVLDMEMVVLTGENLQSMQNTGGVFYDWKAQENVVLTRGRRCDEEHRECETVLIDDYRYERIFMVTNIASIFSTVAWIRGLAQIYVWVRVAMLVIGISWSTWCENEKEPVSVLNKIRMCWVNLLKVPSHVVVYGTMIPVILYALAHLIDSYMYHLIVQDGLSTTLGQDALMKSVALKSTYVFLKMRNIWFIALVCIAVVGYDTMFRHQGGWRHRMGIVGFRGTMMGSLSCTTIIFPARFPSLRRVDIRSFTRHDVNWHVDALWTSLRTEFSPATTGPFLETRCLFLALIVFANVLLILKFVSIMMGSTLPRLTDHSTIVPYSAGRLWPTTSLTGYWKVKLARDRRKTSTVLPNGFSPVLVDKRGRVVPTPTHIRALRIEKRSEQMWALVRLMNIVMMTNPWVYVRLRYVGVRLYLYRLKSQSGVAHSPNASLVEAEIRYILPERIDKLYEKNQLEHADRFELVKVVNSKSLTWNELIMCG